MASSCFQVGQGWFRLGPSWLQVGPAGLPSWPPVGPSRCPSLDGMEYPQFVWARLPKLIMRVQEFEVPPRVSEARRRARPFPFPLPHFSLGPFLCRPPPPRPVINKISTSTPKSFWGPAVRSLRSLRSLRSYVRSLRSLRSYVRSYSHSLRSLRSYVWSTVQLNCELCAVQLSHDWLCTLVMKYWVST